MENLGWIIYWITRLDGIQQMLSIMAFIFFIGTVLWVGGKIASIIEPPKSPDTVELLNLFLKKTAPIPAVFFICLLLASLMPSTKDAALIYIAPRIANSQAVQELPADFKVLKDMGMEKLKDMLKIEKGGK